MSTFWESYKKKKKKKKSCNVISTAPNYFAPNNVFLKGLLVYQENSISE